MDAIPEDEKKPIVDVPEEKGDQQPDPDEHLMLDQGNGSVWFVRIPKHLLERWKAVSSSGETAHLATIRVYQNALGPRKHRIILFLPPNIDPTNPTQAPPPQDPRHPKFDNVTHHHVDADAEPEFYDLNVANDNVVNQFVVAERPKDASFGLSGNAASQSSQSNSRARTTILTGRVKHECSLRPAFNARYRNQMRMRSMYHNTPRRGTKHIDESGLDKGSVSKLSTGASLGGPGGGAFDFGRPKPKAKGQFERMARMPRNELLDALFGLFKQQPYWGVKPLRERTQQPEAYLKEVLADVATLHRSGDNNGMWELKPMFAGGMDAEGMAAIKSDPGADGNEGDTFAGMTKMEDQEEGIMDDEDDEDDDDMEEVA
ncbi:transcription initiation factor IIF, beta subunit-domain-containing protein [Schizophyllum amplum]|uniref:Transcription initiation factor IIF subunit beta n=1 Tax=Schizophyllum amplum TaxID=97359 RepID=A0A550CX03_9AGAR|nr:transcription initiation factor IIF, beta subunit-domain-containing protein [Auriculariopsis ampla]